mmetsp:Transcript_43033/g.135045  ORF Transcript_43033/g.135045 Transcript_43033/m.135045 type:complete len:1005 (-) Transcript_43033:173-3187(-)
MKPPSRNTSRVLRRVDELSARARSKGSSNSLSSYASSGSLAGSGSVGHGYGSPLSSDGSDRGISPPSSPGKKEVSTLRRSSRHLCLILWMLFLYVVMLHNVTFTPSPSNSVQSIEARRTYPAPLDPSLSTANKDEVRRIHPVLRSNMDISQRQHRRRGLLLAPSDDSFVRLRLPDAIKNNHAAKNNKELKLQIGAPPRRKGSTSWATFAFKGIPRVVGRGMTLVLFVAMFNDGFHVGDRLLLCKLEEGATEPSFIRGGAPPQRDDCHLTDTPIIRGGVTAYAFAPAAFARDEKLNVALLLLEEDAVAAWKRGDMAQFQQNMRRDTLKDYILFDSMETSRQYFRPYLVVGEDLTEERKLRAHPAFSRTLVAVPVDDDINAVVRTLEMLSGAEDDCDVVAIAFHSNHGTNASRLRKLGYAVLQSKSATDFAELLNEGYRYAKKSGSYSNYVVVTSDMLVPRGAITGMAKTLQSHPFVVPARASFDGTFPYGQKLTAACHLSRELVKQLTNFHDIQAMQDALPVMCGTRSREMFLTDSAGLHLDVFGVNLETAVPYETATGGLFVSKYFEGSASAGAELAKALPRRMPLSREAVVAQYVPAAGDIRAGEEWRMLQPMEVVTARIVAGNSQKEDIRSLVDQLQREFRWRVEVVDVYSENAHDAGGVDIALVLTPLFDVRKFTNAKSNLATIGWFQGEEDTWHGRPWAANYDLVLSSEPQDRLRATAECTKKCPIGDWKADVTVPVLEFDDTIQLEVRGTALRKGLSKHGLMPASAGACNHIEKPQQVCFLVRTYFDQKQALEELVNSLVDQSTDAVDVRAFIVNTDMRRSPEVPAFEAALEEMEARVNAGQGRCAMKVLKPDFVPDRNIYGYDVTDWATDLILRGAGCTHMVFTNGDNSFSGDLIETIEDGLAVNDMIAWDFETHHHRSHGGNLISVALEKRFIDLASFVVRSDVLRNSGAKFLPRGVFSRDVFARDWHFVEKVAMHLKDAGRFNKIQLLHKTMLHHL